MQFGQAGVDEKGRLIVEMLADDGDIAAHLVLVIATPPKAPERHIGFGMWSRIKSVAGKRV